MDLILMALSYLALGSPSSCPPRGRAGCPRIPAQVEMATCIGKMVKSFGRLANASASCGLRLPLAATRLEALACSFGNLDFVPYARSRSEARSAVGSSTTEVSLRPLIASRQAT